jgi:hypothetical protein
MENSKTQLDSYVSVNDRQKQVTGQLHNILPEQVPEPESEGEFLADTIRDMFPTELLYHPDVLAGPTTLYHVIRGVLLLLFDRSFKFASPLYLSCFARSR